VNGRHGLKIKMKKKCGRKLVGYFAVLHVDFSVGHIGEFFIVGHDNEGLFQFIA
jgi:hypothetical protein